MDKLSTFDKLKNISNSRIEQTKKKFEKGGYKQDADTRFWKHSYDKKTKIGLSIVRFIGPAKNESEWFVNKFTHFIGGPNKKWYVESCPKSMGKNHKCPSCEKYNQLWDNSSKDNTAASKYKPRKQYIVNLLVVADAVNPENNGKVFLYEMNKTILDKIREKMNPDTPLETPVDPIDMWTGCNFRIKTKDKSGWLNYESSTFDSQTPIFPDGTDEQYQELWEKLYPLNEFVSENNFKPYSELKLSFDSVFGVSSYIEENTSNNTKVDETIDDSLPDNVQTTADQNNDDSVGTETVSANNFFDDLKQ